MLESDFEMAAAKNNTSSDSDSRNDRSVVNILFVDEDEILFNTQSLRTNFTADESGFDHEESDESTSDEGTEEEMEVEVQDWSEETFSRIISRR